LPQAAAPTATVVGDPAAAVDVVDVLAELPLEPDEHALAARTHSSAAAIRGFVTAVPYDERWSARRSSSYTSTTLVGQRGEAVGLSPCASL